MSRRLLPPLRASDRRVAAIAVAALALLAGVAAVAPALAQSTDPTSAPDAVGRVYEGQSWVDVTPQLVWNLTYDLTFTNLTEGIVEGASVSVVAPGGRVVDTRAAYADSGTVGAYNVTFPGLFPGAAGEWLLTAEGMANRTFHVNFTSDYHVSLSQSEFEESDGSVSFVVSVVHATEGYAISGAEVRLDDALLGQTGTDGQYVYFGPTPSLGTHSVSASREFGGDAQPEVFSSTTLTVVAAPAPVPLVHVADSVAAPDGINTTVVAIDDASDLGTLTLDIRYNASVVAVDNVTGVLSGASVWWLDDAANGTLRILVTVGTSPGPSGDLALAKVQLRAVGQAGSTSPLALEVVEAAHSDGTLFAADARSGEFRVGLQGDADADGDVDSDDLRAIVQKVLGAQSAVVEPWAADLNRDGAVTGIDAMLLEQRLRAGA